MPRPRIATDPLLTLAGVGLASELIYWLIFVRPFPLARLYDTIPPVDYAKLTGHSVGGAVSFTLAILALFIGYVVVLRTLCTLPEHPSGKRWAWGVVIGGTILFAATLALAYPTTAIDVLIYAVRTRGWALYGLNPLATAPQDLPGDPWVGLAAEWVGAPSPYGLVWEGTSLLAFRLVGGDFLGHLFALKTIATLAHLGCAGLVAVTLHHLKPDWTLVGTAAFAWNPLALLESAGNGHNDILMAFFLLLAVSFAASDRPWPWPLWRPGLSRTPYRGSPGSRPGLRDRDGTGRDRDGRGWLVMSALTLSIFTKFTPVMALPFFVLYLIRQETSWGRRLAVAAGNLALALGMGVVLMLPVWPGWENWAIRGLGQGAGKSPFALLVLILRPWLTTNVAFDVSRYLLGGSFLIIYVWLAWRALTGPPTLTRVVLAPTFGVFFWYLMLPNQQFHAWYLLWPLAMGVLLIPSLAFSRVVVFGLTALLSITLYETLRVWWWDVLNTLVLHTIAVPFVFGPPLLVGIRDCLPWRVGQGRLEIGDG